VVTRFKDCIDDFKQILPLVEELANPALKRRHWWVLTGYIYMACVRQTQSAARPPKSCSSTSYYAAPLIL
jgi:hypothetical protein